MVSVPYTAGLGVVLAIAVGVGLAAAGPPAPGAYLGKEADLISRIVLRPAHAIVLLSEPCGVLHGYSRARLFSYRAMKSTPTAERDGCYGKTDRAPDSNGSIVIYASDGTTLGKVIAAAPAAEAFAPRKFFVPFGDAGHPPPKIVAIGVLAPKHPTARDYSSIGLTRQPCPVDASWFLARHIPAGRSDQGCWEPRGDSIAIRDIDSSNRHAPRLSPEEKLVDKAGFFAAATLATTPIKYDWPPG